MNWTAVIWLVLLVLFLAAEAATVTMTTIWFAGGSLAAMLVSLVGGPGWLQMLAFLAVSCILLTLLRPMVRKHITPNITKTNVDAVVGTTGLVTVAIDNVEAVGQVKLGGMVWTARSASGEKIPEGTLIRVERIEGVKAIVAPAEVKV